MPDAARFSPALAPAPSPSSAHATFKHRDHPCQGAPRVAENEAAFSS